MMMWVWVGVFVLMVVMEAASSYSLVSIWFAVGALAGIFAAALGAPVWAQILFFVTVGAMTLFMLRPYMKEKIAPKITKTNLDCIEGATAVAIEEVSLTAGAVKAEGKEWNARTTGGIIEVGQMCRVVKMEGIKLIVTTNLERKGV